MVQSKILLETGTNEVEIVEFYIEEDIGEGKLYTGYYGLNVAKVLEIIRKPKVTDLPNKSHPAVMGAFTLRKRVIPLVDLSLWLGKDMARTDAAKVIVTEFSQVITAFMVSGVTRIHRLSWEQIEPPDINIQQYGQSSITGVVKIEDRVVFILDMEQIVADINPELAVRMEEADQVVDDEDDVTYRALIADDSNSIRQMLGRSLEKAGFEVVRTVNGREALETLLDWKKHSQEEKKPITTYVDVIISDIEMPGMDGHSLTRRIKEDPVLGTLPVILFSSLITDNLRHKGEAVGADDQISKPELPHLVSRAMELIHRFQDVR